MFVLGPAAVTLLVDRDLPGAAGSAVATVVCVAGVLGSPPSAAPSRWSCRREADADGPDRPQAGPSHVPARGHGPPALIVLVPVYLFLGVQLMSIDLSTVAFAQHSAQGAGRLDPGTYALGSATGGAVVRLAALAPPTERRFALPLGLPCSASPRSGSSRACSRR